jgi:hypothetical protein
MKINIPWYERPCVRVKEATQIIGVGPTKTYELINEGRLETLKIDECTLITVPSIKRLLASAPTTIGRGPRRRDSISKPGQAT